MKICYVITKSAEIGGAQIHVRDLSIKMKSLGHHVTVVTGEDGELSNQLRRSGIEVVIIDSLVRELDLAKDIKSIFKLRSLLAKIHPDIVSLHSSKAGVIGRLANLFSPRKVIFTAHGWAFADGVSVKAKYLYTFIERLLSFITDKIITVSHQDKVLALKSNVASEEKQTVIHNGMPNFQLARQVKKDQDKFKFVMVARYTAQKDHKTLFEALDRLPTGADWTVDLIGSGPNFELIKNLSARYNSANKVRFLGQVTDVSQRLFDYDAFLLISNWEGFPRSILEAMRTGLPVIASNVGGVSESLIEGKGGYLIPRGDDRLLAQRMLELMEDRKLAVDMGKYNKQSFEENFTFDAMFAKTFSTYGDVINNIKTNPSRKLVK